MLALQVAVMKGRGGILTSVVHYARMWDRVGIPSICLYRGPAVEQLRAAGVDVVDAPRSLTSPLSFLAPDLGRLRRKISILGGGEPDFIVVHSDLALQALQRMFPAAVIIACCHSDKTKRKRNTDIVVTLNPEQHERVTRELAGFRPRIVMLGNPFATEPAQVAGDGPRRVNYVARFVADKDPLTFARAVTVLRARPLPPIRLIGDGPLKGEVQRALLAAGVEAEFPGWRLQPFDDFSRNDILVLPSKWEGLPWLLLEAQARGVPAIASDIPGNKHALGDGAYGDIFRVGDHEAMAACLDAALTDLGPLRAKAECGRARLSDRFGTQAFWRQFQGAMISVRGGEALG